MNDRKSEWSRGSRNVSLVALCGFTCQRCGIGDSNGAGKEYFCMAISCSVVDVFIFWVEV
jgi:hypothetical protein